MRVKVRYQWAVDQVQVNPRVAGRSTFVYDNQRLTTIPKDATSHACSADKSHRRPSAYRSSE